MVTCQSSELGWEVTVELPTDFLSLGRGSVTSCRVSSSGGTYSFMISSRLGTKSEVSAI